MLRLKGQTESGEWVEFGIDEIWGTNKAKCILNGDFPKTVLLTDTIKLADDPQTPTRIKCSNCGQCFDTDIVDVFARCDNCQTEIAISSQPADDPRKAMLAELREKINNLTEYKSFVRVEGDPVPTLPQIAKWCVEWILDEMEAKL